MQASKDRGKGKGLAALCIVSLALSMLSACGEGDGAADGGQEASTSIDGEAGGAQKAPVISEDTPLGQSVAAYRKALKGESWRGHIEGYLKGWRGDRQPMTDLLRETYRRREYEPVFLDGLWPSAAAGVMVKAVREIPSHGLPSSPYRPKVVLPLYSALALDDSEGEGTLSEQIGDLERLARLEAELPRTIYKRPRKSERVPEVIYRPLKELPELPEIEPEVGCLLDALHAATLPGGPSRNSEVAERCEMDEGNVEKGLAKAREVLQQRQEQASSLALLDALLLQSFYQWVLDFSIDRRVHPFRSYGPVNRTRHPTKHRGALLKALDHVDDAEAFSKLLKSKVPRDPEYDLARKALDRYVRLMDEAKEADLDDLRASRRLEKGDEGEAVEALQRRLVAEEYLPSSAVNGSFDEATHKAVVRYQQTHSLADGGIVGDDTVDNLNIPMEWRVKQILATLGRWRESPMTRRGVPAFHVVVNLPAFELEVIEQGKTIRRHSVIVGSNRRAEDPLNDGVVWHLHRSPLFHTVINEVVLNPNWIVPRAIRVDEIEPKVRENPNYLAENNFTKVDDLLVQGPGETNPLGVVKFSLESTDAIYLHDTDKRWLFGEINRDLSHGCVRVNEPVDLAKFVLRRQGVDESRIDRRIESHATLPIKLEEPIPIFVEYRTVGFTEGEEPIFYRDIYEYDVAYWKKRTPITRRFP